MGLSIHRSPLACADCVKESALTSVSLGEPPAYEQGVYSTPVVRNFV